MLLILSRWADFPPALALLVARRRVSRGGKRRDRWGSTTRHDIDPLTVER
jgi:hypothetical protein